MIQGNAHIWLQRFRDTGKQTLGNLVLVVDGVEVFTCVALELSWMLNQPNVSCIAPDTYPVEKRENDRFGKHLHVKDVPDRTWILFHALNVFKESEGCIGVGKRFKFLDKDNEYDITNSRLTLNKILDLIPDGYEIKLTVLDHDEKQIAYNYVKT
ncbi:MAG: DUF5675 family protein [Balneola sp.]